MTSLPLRATAAFALAMGMATGGAGAQTPPKNGAGPAASGPAKADAAKLQEAKKHMEAGAAFYSDPSGHKCEEAYREFKKAYDLSGSLNALRAMGICALELERDGEAIERFETYLAEKGGKIDPGEKAQTESDLKALRAAMARVTLRSDRPGFRLTDVRTPTKGVAVTNDYEVSSEQTLGIHPGKHTFTATAEGGGSLIWTVNIANGGTYAHTFDFSKAAAGADKTAPGSSEGPAEALRPVPSTVYLFGSLTLVLTVPTVILMARAKGKSSDYAAQNGRLQESALEAMRSDVTSANLVADIFLGATVASLAATGIFYGTRPSRSAEPTGIKETKGRTSTDKEKEQTGAWFVLPTVGSSGGGALVTGRF